MYDDEKKLVSVVIAAAGKGSRMGLDMNKQYHEIQGKAVLARTIQKFETSGLIHEIIIVAHEAEIEFCKKYIVEKYGFTKVKMIVVGGATRQQSVYNGLRKVSPECGVVLIHDGARPFVDLLSIADAINAAKDYGVAVVGVPAKDTIKQADRDDFVEKTVDRNSLWYIQTPQAFQYELIMKAHRKAAEDGFDGTDDAVLAERMGLKVKLIMGSYYNIKITTREDLIIAEAISRIFAE